MVNTTIATARGSASALSQGQGSAAIAGSSRSMAATPPTAEASVPTSVTPTCTVARKRSGSCLRRRAAAARGWPSSARARRRAVRALTTAISAPAKKALRRIRTPIRASSTTNPSSPTEGFWLAPGAA